jgi:pimeloyl-ACP methyl ester carboxylesterase
MKEQYLLKPIAQIALILSLFSLSVACQSLKYESAKPLEFEELTVPGDMAYFEVMGQKLAYYDSKVSQSGKTLVFLHGLGEHSGYWRVTTKALEKRHRVIAIDLMGHGKSAKPSQKEFYALRNQAKIIHSLLAHLGLEQVFLVGHSMGGQISMHFALQYPDALKHLILLCPAGIEAFTASEADWMKQNVKAEGFESRDEGALRAHFQKYVFGKWSEEAEHHLAERVRLKKAKDFKAYTKAVVASIHAMLDEPVRHELNQIKIPVTVIFGLDDALIPNTILHHGGIKEVLADTQKLLPHAKLVEWPNIGHMIQIEAINETNLLLEQILLLDGTTQKQ